MSFIFVFVIYLCIFDDESYLFKKKKNLKYLFCEILNKCEKMLECELINTKNEHMGIIW